MSNLRIARRIGVAAVVSAAAHAAVITLARLELPQRPPDFPPIAVRIVNEAPAPAFEAPRTPDAPPERAPRAAVRVAVAPPARIALPTQTEPYEPAPEEALPPEPPATAAATEPVVLATAPSSTLKPDARPLPAFPRKGRITFNLVYGRDQFPVGQTVQTWEVDGTRYQLTSRSETNGIVDLFRSQHRTYLSRGALTEDGLRPESFLMSRNRGRGPEEARAQFDWSSGNVTLGPAASQREHALPRGSQDLVSFMYQLALDPPPPGRLRMPVTNGTRLETYVLEVFPEEKIETPLGVLRALPIRQVRAPGTEGIDLWLATEYRHLPVRIRIYGRDGELAGEQIVREIRLSDD